MHQLRGWGCLGNSRQLTPLNDSVQRVVESHPVLPFNLMQSFRLGATSYILPADLITNLRYLAGKVQDVELVLFDLDDGPSNLPSKQEVAALGRLACQSGISFTVHLPLDLHLGSDSSVDHISVQKARKVIELTLPLDPWAYIAHLEGREVQHGAAPRELERWQVQAVRALEVTSAWIGDPARLALENLEGYPLDLLMPVLAACPVSRCVDIGHLWLDGHDPLPYLRQALPRTRVIHLHGLNGRDHQSLTYVPARALEPVLECLLVGNFPGVITLEVFGEPDFTSSLEYCQSTLRELRQNGSRAGSSEASKTERQD